MSTATGQGCTHTIRNSPTSCSPIPTPTPVHTLTHTYMLTKSLTVFREVFRKVWIVAFGLESFRYLTQFSFKPKMYVVSQKDNEK